MSAEAKLVELGLQLPPAPTPKGVYRPVVVVGNLAYTSGHVSTRADGSVVAGRVGADMDAKSGYEAARLAGLALLSSLRAALGSLDRVRRVVKTVGFVQCAGDFQAHPAVINGCSELLAEVFGPQRGVGARSALGAPALPLGGAVEIELIVEIEP